MDKFCSQIDTHLLYYDNSSSDDMLRVRGIALSCDLPVALKSGGTPFSTVVGRWSG